MDPETHLLIATIGYAVSLAMVLGLGIFVLSRKPKGHTHQMMFLMCFSIALYQLAFIIGVNLDPSPLSYWVWYSNIVVDVLIGLFVLHFFIRATKSMDRFEKFLKGMYIAGAFIIVTAILFPEDFAVGVIPKLYFKSYLDASGILYPLVVLFFLISFAAAFYVLFSERSRAGSEGRTRINYYIAGLTYGFITGVTAFAPDFNLPIDPAFSALIGTFIIPFVYGMIKKDLLDIRIVLRRTVIYTGLIALLTALLTAVSLISNWVILSVPGLGLWVVPLLAALGAVGVGELYFRKSEEADHIKSEFITVISHKFRAPLTRIRWQTDALATQKDIRPEIKKGVEQINESALELIRLSNLLIGTVHVEKEGSPSTYTDLSLLVLTKRALIPFERIIEQKYIHYSVTSDPNLPAIQGDAERLTDAIHVLIENAVVYTPEKGKIKITITADKDTIRFSITDTGMGITDEDETFIFSRFYRSDRARRVDTEGMGLGLFMAKNIIESHKGTMGVDSEGEGKGSTFWFTLPVERKE